MVKISIEQVADAVNMLATPHNAVKELGSILQEAKVDYAITGGVALGIHNYFRATDDVDVIVSKEGFETIKEELIGRYFQFRPGSTRNVYFSFMNRRIPVDFIIEGDNKSGLVLGNPKKYRERKNGVWWVNLPKLLEIKISGGFQKNREADWPDAIRLIRENELEIDFLENSQADERVKRKYVELFQQVG